MTSAAADRPVDGLVVAVPFAEHAATDTVQAPAGRLPGMRGVSAGPLRNARHVEAPAVVLGSVDERYRAHAGLRVTGV